MSVQTSDTEVIKLRGARKVTAKRMHNSLQSTAPVTLTRMAPADSARELQLRLREEAPVNGIAPTLNDIVLYAVAQSLKELPEINARFRGDQIERVKDVNLGFAVDTGRALLVPVIRAAQNLTLLELAAESNRLVDLSKTGRLTANDMADGTFTVSNLGAFGIQWFTPVINAPEVGILGVGAMHRDYEGNLQIPLSLTFDHQALDGVSAARALGLFAESINDIGRNLV